MIFPFLQMIRTRSNYLRQGPGPNGGAGINALRYEFVRAILDVANAPAAPASSPIESQHGE
jgi:hypothetical protein